MTREVKIREVTCKSAIGKCGFPGGGWAINPYIGCSHGCTYCYARFMKRFTGHEEMWGTFVDVRTNIADIAKRQLQSPRLARGRLYIGTVTDPYQSAEARYELTRSILSALIDYQSPVCILTKSGLVVRDLDVLKRLKEVAVSFTVNTTDEQWKSLVEPGSPTIKRRFQAMKALSEAGIVIEAMMGPYWPGFTDPESLFEKFKEVGVSHVFTESVNTIGGNWTGVDQVLRKQYPHVLTKMRQTLFDKRRFHEFYGKAASKIQLLSQEFQIPVTIFF